MTKYKYLNEDGTTPYQNHRPDTSGEWSPPVADPQECKRGYHCTDVTGLSTWLTVGSLWEVETRGQEHRGHYKTAHEQMRFVRKVSDITPDLCARFARACSDRVQHLGGNSAAAADAAAAAAAARAAYARDAAAAAAAAAAERQWQGEKLLEMIGEQ